MGEDESNENGIPVEEKDNKNTSNTEPGGNDDKMVLEKTEDSKNNNEKPQEDNHKKEAKKTDQNDRFSLKVKKEFILTGRAESLGPLPPPPATVEGHDGKDENDNNNDVNNNNNSSSNIGNNNEEDTKSSKKKKKRRKGMNKKRPRDARQDDSEKICLGIIRSGKCQFGDSCRYSHDVKAFMATRPTDIAEITGGCPIYKNFGYCLYGATCRLGSSHITKTGENMYKDSAILPDEDAVLPLPDSATNLLPKDVQTLLRKKKYPFKCKRFFEKDDEKEVTPKEEGEPKQVATANVASTEQQSPKQQQQQKEDGDNKTTSIPASSMSTSSTPLDMRTKKKKIIDFSNKVYVAPLTTVGNLPFRRIMKKFGADITCGEMAVATNLLEGKAPEWALLKRHKDEDVFGIQLAAAHADQFTRVSELIEQHIEVDFVDLNLGCPLDIICGKGAGAALMQRDKKLKAVLRGMSSTLSCPITVKMRTGWDMSCPFAHQLVPKIQSWRIDNLGAIMVHGRSRLQRYQRLANWEYISQVANSLSDDMPKIPIIGNGDVFSYTDYEEKMKYPGVSNTAMLGRGALIKPWLPTEIKERRHWDISASERLDILKDFVRFGLEHWGSDQQGVNYTRRFLLEWLSFLHRYVPVGLLEVIPQQMNHRPPTYLKGRNDLETLFLSPISSDWIKISEMLLGPVPEGFKFQPKHKANAYA